MNSKTVKFNQIDISKFNGFLIDIDDTLYSYQKCHLHAIKKCYENFTNLKLFSMSFDEFNNLYVIRKVLKYSRLIINLNSHRN